jgi:hypothetical protein
LGGVGEGVFSGQGGHELEGPGGGGAGGVTVHDCCLSLSMFGCVEGVKREVWWGAARKAGETGEEEIYRISSSTSHWGGCRNLRGGFCCECVGPGSQRESAI